MNNEYRPLKHSAVKIIVFICFLCAVPLIFGQGGSTISGFVFDQQRRPVGEVFVELMNDVNSVIKRAKTDGSGRFFFGNLSAGRFTVRVLPLGTNFDEQTRDVELTGVGALGRPVVDFQQVEFYLRPRKGSIDPINSVVFVQDIPEEAKKLYEKAVSDLNQNRVDEGMKELETALTVFPTYYMALEKLGNLYLYQLKQYEKARDVFNKAVAVNARSFTGWYGLCYANYVLKNSDSAVEAGRKAVELNPTSVEAGLFFGISLRQAKKYEEAEKVLKQVDKLTNGKTPDVYWHLALLYAHNLNRPKDAANALEAYLKLKPDSPDAENIKKLIKQFREGAK